jgi:hypothetical protein
MSMQDNLQFTDSCVIFLFWKVDAYGQVMWLELYEEEQNS